MKILLFCLFFMPISLFGDGKMYSQYDAKILAPKQRAVLFFKNQQETLIIESHFSNSKPVIVDKSTATDTSKLAWVIPLPNIPTEVKQVDDSYLSSVARKVRPTVITNVSMYWLFFVFIGVSAIIFRILFSLTSDPYNPLVILWATILALFLILTQTGGSISSVFSTTSGALVNKNSVSIYNRETIGAYETVTLTSKNANELLNWLNEEGFYVKKDIIPVIKSYIDENWVFFVAKLKLVEKNNKQILPHPLAFTFSSKYAVYPLRLTGFGNGSCSVVLYTVGEKEAECLNFETKQSKTIQQIALRKIVEPKMAYSEPIQLDEFYHTAKILFASSTVIVTKLVGNLSEKQMINDARINWIKPTFKDEVYYPEFIASTYCLNWALPVPLIGLLLWLYYFNNKSLKGFLLILITFCIGFLIYNGLYSWLPIAEIELNKLHIF